MNDETRKRLASTATATEKKGVFILMGLRVDRGGRVPTHGDFESELADARCEIGVGFIYKCEAEEFCKVAECLDDMQ